MTQSLRLLLVEDIEDDALLLVRELRKGGIDPDFTRVESPQELKAALTNGYRTYPCSFLLLPHLRRMREWAMKLARTVFSTRPSTWTASNET